MHGGAPAALLAREIEAVSPGEDMLVARITFEFVGPVPLAPLEADAWIQRPGARYQLVEAELRHQGRTVVKARAVRLRRGDVVLPETALPPSQPPCEGPGEAFHRRSRRGGRGGLPPHGDGDPFRRRDGLRDRTGARVVSPGASACGRRAPEPAAARGRGRRLRQRGQPRAGLRPASVRQHRPDGASTAKPWASGCCSTRVTVADPIGAGLAASRIYDERGAIGVSAQTLFVDAR